MFSPTYDAMTRVIRLRLQQQSQPGAVDAAVVADDRQVAGTLLQQRIDEKPGDAGQSEAADRQAGAVGDVGRPLLRAMATILFKVIAAPGVR